LHLSNKNILITGASSGIGYQLTKDLAKEGANLVLLARRKNILDNLAKELKPFNRKIITAYCDVTSKESVKEAFGFVKEEFGDIDIAILNSGVSHRLSIEEYNSTFIDEVFSVNMFGIVNCLDEIVSVFIEKKEGYIVGVTSLAETRGFPLSAAYCSSKAGASIFLESIRIELKKYNVKVINVKPGFVKTPMTDKNEFWMPFLMNVESASKIILKGIKKEKKIVQFPLPTVLGAKLLRLLPNSLFDYFANLPLPLKK
jgi:short-subunit dehydrogenase